MSIATVTQTGRKFQPVGKNSSAPYKFYCLPFLSHGNLHLEYGNLS